MAYLDRIVDKGLCRSDFGPVGGGRSGNRRGKFRFRGQHRNDPGYFSGLVISVFFVTALSVPIPVLAIDDKALNGELGPLIPVPKDAIHAGLVWKYGADSPSMLFLMRDSSMKGTDIADKALIKEIVAETEAALDAGTSPPRTLFEATNNGNPGDPFSDFRQLVFGGFTLSRNLEESHATRFRPHHLRMENTILADLDHALRTHPASPKFAVRDLTKQDAAVNRAAFRSAGFSRNLGYNLFCGGQVSLTDGRQAYIAGHDKGGNNGIRKINIYDPELGEWVHRVQAPTRLDYADDPTGTDPHFTPNCVDHPVEAGRPPIIDPDTGRCNPRNEENTDPPDPSDMTFQRWYPTAVTLPDGNVLIVGGSDQNSELIKDVCEDVGGNPVECATPGAVKVDVDRNDVNRSKVRQAVAEVYDPQTDTTTPLYNAQKHFGFYPHCFVVQTGDGANDWGVACKQESALTNPGYEGPSYMAADGTIRQDPKTLAANIRRGYDPWPLSGSTYVLDVVGALADPEHAVPRSLQNSDQNECPDCFFTVLSTNHWTFVDTAASAHNFGAETELVTVGDDGNTSSHLVVAFAGDDGSGSSTNTIIEQIDYAYTAATPTWMQGQDFPVGEEHGQNNAVTLPTGKIIVLGGTDRRNVRDRFGIYEYDPATKSLRLVANEVVPRFDHSTALLLPYGTVLIMGGNRPNLMPAIDPGVQDSPADQDVRNLMVPNWRVYKPAYLFNEDGTDAERPEIESAPDAIGFGGTFDIEVEDEDDAGYVASIASCVIIRTSPVTHNWAWGNRWVRLPCSQDGDTVTITEPTHRAQAIAGDYMLFVVNTTGVPSEARHVRLGPAFP